MGLFEQIGSFVANTAEAIGQGAKGIVEDVSAWCNNLVADVGAAITSSFSGDVVGINANEIPNMISAIDSYISAVNGQLDKLTEKANTSTAKAMQGEYAEATKQYIQAAAKTCYNIVTQLKYFQDKLNAVKAAYDKKDQNMSSTINSSKSEMESSWTEYKRQS